MGKFSQGKFQLQHPEKYIGNASQITWRSSWEANLMRTLDNHPAVIEWASEPIKIPYRNPLTGKGSVYVPDFLVKYMKNDTKVVIELIEVKPASQTTIKRAKSKYDKAQLAINASKWMAAKKFCDMRGLVFRILTEDQLFGKKK